MSKRFAIILSGCGVLDGSEVSEAVLTLLSLDKLNHTYKAFAARVDFGAMKHEKIDYSDLRELGETRNSIEESGRIVRGEIEDCTNLLGSIEEFDGLVVVGGFGVVKNHSNLCDVIFGVEKSINFDKAPELRDIIVEFNKAGKPIGALCIATAYTGSIISSLSTPDRPVKVALGRLDQACGKSTEELSELLGCVVDDSIQSDQFARCKNHKLFSTPAFLASQSPATVEQGIRNMLEAMTNSEASGRPVTAAPDPRDSSEF